MGEGDVLGAGSDGLGPAGPTVWSGALTRIGKIILEAGATTSGPEMVGAVTARLAKSVSGRTWVAA